MLMTVSAPETVLSDAESIGGAAKDFIKELLFGGSNMQYENFSFGNQVVTYRMIIIALCLGIIIASAVMLYKRRVLGRMIRALLSREAFGAESAKSLSELSLCGEAAIIASLRHGTLGRMLPSVLKDAHDEKMRVLIEGGEKRRIKSFSPVPREDRYYLPVDEGMREKLVKLFSEKGSGVLSFVLTVVLTVAAAGVLFSVVPWLLGFLDGVL